MNKTLRFSLTVSIFLSLIISCKKSEVIATKIDYLCLLNTPSPYNHQFGVRIDGTTYCSAFREISPRVDKYGELEMFYLIHKDSDKCCPGVIYFKTIGFKGAGKSLLKILRLSTPDEKVNYDVFDSKIANASINIVSISNGLVSGEFEGKVVIDGKAHEVYGNFKDVPVENI